MAVETAKFNERGRPKTKESFKDSRESLSATAATHDVAKESIVRAKAVWDAAEVAGDPYLHVATLQKFLKGPIVVHARRSVQ